MMPHDAKKDEKEEVVGGTKSKQGKPNRSSSAKQTAIIIEESVIK